MNNFNISGFIVISFYPVVNLREVVRFDIESNDFIRTASIDTLDEDNNLVRSVSLSSQISNNALPAQLIEHIINQANCMINSVANSQLVFQQYWIEQQEV